MKAAALLNVRNLAIGVIIAHQSTRPKAIVEVAETSKDNPTQAVIQVDMHNMELRSSRASYREEDEEDQCEENEEKFELKKIDKSTQFNQLGSDESDDNQDNSVEEIKVKMIMLQKLIFLHLLWLCFRYLPKKLSNSKRIPKELHNPMDGSTHASSLWKSQRAKTSRKRSHF